MIFTTTYLTGLILIEPQVFNDPRGFFMETYQARKFAEAGITGEFVQDNHSGSAREVLRGLHYQIQQAQGKLFRTIYGEVYDVAVDIRRNSPTFGQWFGILLSAENKKQLWIPAGFAHGFYTLSDWAEVCYKATDYYAPQWERTLLWNDPDLAIDWPLIDGKAPLVSPKDRQGKSFQEAECYL